MENLAQLAPLIILIPAVGALFNYLFGSRLNEGASALIGIAASAGAFIIALLLFTYLGATNNESAVINPPLLDSWIRMDSIGLDITWQMRVDTLSVTMMLFVTGVGTLIHIYSRGYMHGDPLFSRFFAYLNTFLTFMLILVTGNNFLAMFVGWEGVGLCSYLLIGFWWDKPHGKGWENSNAARKAFIANRVGDLGVLMAMFMIFWTFSTLDFYKPGEITNPNAGQGHGEEHADEADAEEAGEESALILTVFSPQSQDDEGEDGEPVATEEHASTLIRNTVHWSDADVELRQLGVFGQTEYMLHQQEESGEQIDIAFGPVTFSLKTTLVIITLFLLLGATGKSAQIPLFVWLPDAMAGPTPVSALIHAATMVTAGVYMMVRSNVLFSNAEFTSFVVTVIGASTALVAGYIAMGQFDIKRVLAYSTISQLGFMVAAVGVGAYVAAIFHMVTHAFFKALLFLGSGSVIHGVEHGHHHAHAHEHGDEHGDHPDEFDAQDMRNMGGLSRRMPITYITYLIGTLALAGIYPLAGFWSKDEILAHSWLVGLDDVQLKGYIAFGLLLIAAGFTAFYMWRQIEMVFHGDARTDAADHASESVPSMTIPLMVLAFFSIFAGVINIPTPLSSIFTVFLDGIFGQHSFATFLEHSIAEFHVVAFQPIIALLALSLGIGAIFFARSIYRGNKAVKIVDGEMKDPLEVDPAFSAIWKLAHARLYWDQTYYRVFVYPYQRMSAFLANVIDWQFLHDYFHDSVLLRGYNGIGNLLSKPFDLGIIDGAVNGVAWVVRTISGRSRHVQTGYVRTYAVALLLGVVAVIVIMLLPLIKL